MHALHLPHNPVVQKWVWGPAGGSMRNHADCSVHKKNRELSHLIFVDNDWRCKPDHECRTPLCNICGLCSHKSWDCKASLGSACIPREYGRSGSCRECGTPGHSRELCPILHPELTAVCVEHNKTRGLFSMYMVGPGRFHCRLDSQCNMD